MLDIITTRAVLVLNLFECAVLIIKSRVNWPNMTVVLNREAKLLLRNIETHWRNNCCHGKEISITYSESVSVSLVI